jgi:serine/threonine-protein kinase
MTPKTPLAIIFSLLAIHLSFSQTNPALQHPRDQIALQLGAIQMGYTVPFQLVSGNATNAQQAANALLMGRNALDATVARPAVKVQGFVDSPAVDTVEYRDQLYQAVEAVVTSPVRGTVKGSVSLVGSNRKQSVTATLTAPPNSYTIPVPFAVESASSVDAQGLAMQIEPMASSITTLQNHISALINMGVLPVFEMNATVSTLAGGNEDGISDGTGSAAGFGNLKFVAVDSNRTVYVADGNRIRKITPQGAVTTLAGSGEQGFADGTGEAAQFSDPWGVAVDANRTVYVADRGNHRIRKISPAGVVTTLAGSEESGFANGTGAGAKFNSPLGVAVDSNRNVYVADGNTRIRKISPAGVVTTLAGGEESGFADGISTAAKFNNPLGVAVDSNRNVYVADYGNGRIRKISPAGVVSTLAGSGLGAPYGAGAFSDGAGSSASFYNPLSVAVDGEGRVYVADSRNNRIRKITPEGVVSTLAGGPLPIAGYGGGWLDGPSSRSMFQEPTGVAVDSLGNVYVADSFNGRIRKITISQ